MSSGEKRMALDHHRELARGIDRARPRSQLLLGIVQVPQHSRVDGDECKSIGLDLEERRLAGTPWAPDRSRAVVPPG